MNRSSHNARRERAGILHVMSVDVEDYHNQLAMEYQRRVEPPNGEVVPCTEKLLQVFADYGVKGTFFILGEIAAAFPQLVRRIAAQGHQLGIHGYHHVRVSWQTRHEFREAISRAKWLVEDLTGCEADAYRAPCFSINESTLWALDVIHELGFRYDSSIFPISARRYGLASAPLSPYRHSLQNGDQIWEVPMTAIEVSGRQVGACGGGHLRMFPRRFTQYAMSRLEQEGRAAVVYLHPYEVETRPRVRSLPGMSPMQSLDFHFYNFHQRIGRSSVECKVRWLLENYRFGTIEQLIAAIHPEHHTPRYLVASQTA